MRALKYILAWSTLSVLGLILMVAIASAGLNVIAKAKCNQAVEIGVEARVVNNHRCFAFISGDWVDI